MCKLAVATVALITAMAEVYDFVIFGATGFTGQFVCDEVARLAKTESITWAVAGRNTEKLAKILAEVRQRTGSNKEFLFSFKIFHLFLL